MRRQRGRIGLVAMVATMALAFAPQPASSLPEVGWVPNSLVLPPFPNFDANAGKLTWLHTTRRVVPQQRVPGRLMLGHALYGLWESVPGVGWTPLTPQCLSIVGSLLIGPTLPVLPGCGVEGIAFDESGDVRAPLSMYVSTYNIDLLAPGTPVAHGGVYKAEIRAGTQRIGTAGLLWRQLLPGVRGNAITVRRIGSAPAAIVVGRIQKNSGDVGTDVNAFCAPDCSPSVYVSHDDGTTWFTRTFAGSPCSPAVPTSSRLVGGLDWDRRNTSVFYAAANSGLWVSTDSGSTWTNAFYSCGNSPGFAITELTPPNAGRVYVGRNTDASLTSDLWSATAGPGGTSPFSQIALTDASTGQPFVFPGWIQSIVIDERDPSERTLFVGAWRNANANGGGGLGGVYKVVDRGNGTGVVTDLRASFLEPYRNCLGAMTDCLNRLNPPYPLIQSPLWRPTLFLAQHPLLPDLLYASSVLGGVWTRSDGDSLLG